MKGLLTHTSIAACKPRSAHYYRIETRGYCMANFASWVR